MLIFDQLKKNDPQLRLLAALIFCGMAVLLAGLWWVQVVSARDYQTRLETQSFRTIRVPAVRGKILDRNGVALADNLPRFSACLYLEELRRAFDSAYTNELSRLRAEARARIAAQEQSLQRRLTSKERARLAVNSRQRAELRQRVRYEVASNLVAELGEQLRLPVALDESEFRKHYIEKLVLPYPIVSDLDATNLARFAEQSMNLQGVDLDLQPLRYYPYQTLAAHLLGQLRRDVSSVEGEDAFLNYPLPVFRGTVGIEAAFDSQLRGRAGSKSVLVNNLGYRQSESVWSPVQPGDNVVLTLDAAIQQAAERALRRNGPNTRGAAVVLDPRNGDILALASSPTYDPNKFVQGITRAEWDALSDPQLRPQLNRAVQENYEPGSIFKIVTALACLEAGINPSNKIYNPGYIYIGPRKIDDTARAGEYDFHRAFIKSSNTYFITNGIKTGMAGILRLCRQLHLGERTGLPTRQEVPGILPDLDRYGRSWRDGDTANICIGQGPLAVTPLQMAVMTAAIANGGVVFQPRLVQRIEPQDELQGGQRQTFPSGQIRNQLGVKPQHLQLVREAMLADTEDPEGTAYQAFNSITSPGPKSMRVCGKTGTAEVERGGVNADKTTWFVSFAPYENPRYVVVVMVESGGSGGTTCAPIARDIYVALERIERNAGNKNVLAQTR